jgi:hypothetical protein
MNWRTVVLSLFVLIGCHRTPELSHLHHLHRVDAGARTIGARPLLLHPGPVSAPKAVKGKTEPRTSEQVAVAACTKKDGTWGHCTRALKPPVTVPPPTAMELAAAASLPAAHAATAQSPIVPPSWTVLNWYVDGARTLSCTSDINSCTSATCGAAGSGIGPCQTLGEIQQVRWGGYIYAQDDVTVHLISPSPTSDPWFVTPIPGGAGSVTVTGSTYSFAAALPTAVNTILTAQQTWAPDGGNPYLTATDVWVNDSNSTTLASDSNDCLTATTPCLRNYELTRRRGGIAVSNTGQTLHEIGTNNGYSDPIQWTPCGIPQVANVVQGELEPVGSPCTITTVTNRVIGTTASAGTQATVTASCITAVGQFVTDTTQNSNAIVKSVVTTDAGSTWTLLQQLAPCVASNCTRAENNAWAPGDTITVYTFPALDVDIIGSGCGDGSGFFAFQHGTFANAVTSIVGTFPLITESEVDGDIVNLVSVAYPEFYNVAVFGGAVQIPNHQGAEYLIGIHHAAAFRGGMLTVDSDVEGASFDLGVDLENGAAVQGDFTDVYFGAGNALFAPGASQFNLDAQIWGPGVWDLQVGATVDLMTCGAAVARFLNGAPDAAQFSFNGLTEACTTTFATGVNTCGIPTTAVELDNPAGFAPGNIGAWLAGSAVTCPL